MKVNFTMVTHCNGTMIVYDERHVTEIRPISEGARGWPQENTKCQKVSTVLMGRGCITVWVTEYTDRWACVVTYLCVHSESKMPHSSGPYMWFLGPHKSASRSFHPILYGQQTRVWPTDHATCSVVTMRATRQKNGIILQQIRFGRALTVNLSCQSTADTSVDVCGEEMSSDSSLLRFGHAAAT